MSSQKGNVARQRPQKHQNRVAFKNTLHDTSLRTKQINNLQVSNVCVRCKEVIEWKIKYKKYKPLTQMKTCVKCSQKTVRHAYHVMCGNCAKAENRCAKCCRSDTEIVTATTESEEAELTREMKTLLKSLSERKRRSFLRYMSKKPEANGDKECSKEDRENELMDKLKCISLENEDDFDISDEDLEHSDNE